MSTSEIVKLKNKISSLEVQVRKQKDTIDFLESTYGAIVNDADILHQALKYSDNKLSGDVVFKVAINWYREQQESNSKEESDG